MNKLGLRFICVCAASVLAGCTVGSSEAEEWRSLTKNELSEGWRQHVPDGAATVRLDFDGDESFEVASLVVSRDGTRSAIQVCSSSKLEDKGDCLVLATSENIAASMGLERIRPGCYNYRSSDDGKGAGQICTRFDGLEYFKFGSASSFFLLDPDKGQIVRFWDAD